MLSRRCLAAFALMMVAAGAIAVYGVVLLARFHPATDSAEAM